MNVNEVKKGVVERLLDAFSSLAARRERQPVETFPDLPWAEPMLPLRDAVVAIVTTGGVHLKKQPPFDLSHAGDPSLRRIPVTASTEELVITHGYYDHTAAEADLNVILPIQRLLELKKEGVLGELYHTAYSLMGHLGESRLQELREKTAVRIAEDLCTAGVNYALLLPA